MYLPDTLTNLLGIRYPILQGAMGVYGAGPKLVAAVSNAGGLGIIASWQKSINQLENEIEEIQSLTQKPFAVNIIPPTAGFEKKLDLMVAKGVKIVTTGRGDPREPMVKAFKDHGLKVLAVVPTVRHALRLENEGADCIIASGCEAGGHVGQISTLPLIPQVVKAVKIPVIAAGGIANGAGLLAALALGACGIQMGTRFLLAKECSISDEWKEILRKSSEEETIVSASLTGRTVRFIKTKNLIELLELEKANKTSEYHKKKGNMVRKELEGDPQLLAAGQIMGLIDSVYSVQEIIESILTEAEEILNKLNRFETRHTPI